MPTSARPHKADWFRRREARPLAAVSARLRRERPSALPALRVPQGEDFNAVQAGACGHAPLRVRSNVAVGAELGESRMYAHIGPLGTIDILPGQIGEHGGVRALRPTEFVYIEIRP